MAMTVQRPGSDLVGAPEHTHDPCVRRIGSTVSMAFSLVLLTLLVVGGFFFWPLRFGGSTTVVWVSGESMEPTLSSNDPWLPTADDVLGEVVAETQHGTLLHDVIERTASPRGLGVIAGVSAAVMVFRATRRRPTDSVKTVDQIEP